MYKSLNIEKNFHGCLILSCLCLIYLDNLKKQLGLKELVYLSERNDSVPYKKYIIKFVPMCFKETEQFEEKIKFIQQDVLKKTAVKSNPFLLKYTEVFEAGGYFCIVMEYCSKGDLQSLLDKKKTLTKKVIIIIFVFAVVIFIIIGFATIFNTNC
jgi:serine/threonine protein kinase